MANGKFSVLKVMNHGEWLRSCPLFVVRSQIIRNNETNKLFVANEMANIGIKAIQNVIVRMDCLDAEGKLVSSVDNCAYKGMNVEKQAIFGGNKVFGIPDGTESVSVIIKNIEYTDGTAWSNNYLLKGIQIGNPVKIDPQDEVYDIVAARCKDNHVVPKFWPYEFDGGWRCTCAQLNDEEDMVCSLCGVSKFWVLDNLNREDILDYKQRVERERKLVAEREAEEQRRAEEEARLAAEREEEERRIAAEQAEQERRIAAEREAEEARLAAEREAEERRLAAEREAEERRLAAERAEEERRRAEEEARLAAEREAEEKRLAEIRAIEEAKRAEAEKKAAEERARLELLMAKKEAVRQYNKQQTKKSFKRNIVLVCVLVAIVIIGFGAFQLYQLIRINDRYESAKNYVSNYKFEEAIDVYKSLGNYKDAQEMVLQTKYEYAEYLTIIDRYEDAIAMYSSLGNYKNSAQNIANVYAKWGDYARENKQFAEAFEYYEKAGNAVNPDTLKQTSHEYGLNLMENGKYQEAIEIFNKDIERVGNPTLIAECYYHLGKGYLEQGRFDEAIEAFAHCYGVEDAVELNKKAYYLKGNKMQTANKVEEAYNCYLNAADYEDAQEKKESLTYDMGLIRLKEGNYNAAVLLLESVADSSEIPEEYNKAKYEYAESMLSQNVDEKILEIYKNLPDDFENCKERIKLIEEYIKYVGTYTCEDEKAVVSSVTVKMTVVNNEVVLKANGETVTNSTLKSENCTIAKNGSLKFVNSDGKTYTYKK